MRRAAGWVALVCAFASLLAWAPVSHAHSALDAVVPGLGDAQRLPSGLYEVRLRTGGTLQTHGVDGPSGSGGLLAAGERPPVCTASEHQRVLYGRPAGAPDRAQHAREAAVRALWEANAELDRAALLSGGRHADLRVRCDGDGGLAVTSFVNPRSASFGDVVDAARLAGATDPAADYLILYDAPADGRCGVASFIPDARPGPENANNRGGAYAVAYAGCWTATTVLHEIAHTQGAVQPDAPNGTGSGAHCRDEVDVMCYADGGDRDTGPFNRCPGSERFDCGDDDYFDAAPEPGEYLETHWNLGSPANAFLWFSDVAPDELLAATSASTCADECAPQGADGGPRLAHPRVGVGGSRARVAIACEAEDACTGDVTVRRGRRVAGIAWFDVPAGTSATVTVKLRRWARRAHAKRRLGALRAELRPL